MDRLLEALGKLGKFSGAGITDYCDYFRVGIDPVLDKLRDCLQGIAL
jgi:hypothetical protein